MLHRLDLMILRVCSSIIPWFYEFMKITEAQTDLQSVSVTSLLLPSLGTMSLGMCNQYYISLIRASRGVCKKGLSHTSTEYHSLEMRSGMWGRMCPLHSIPCDLAIAQKCGISNKKIQAKKDSHKKATTHSKSSLC